MLQSCWDAEPDARPSPRAIVMFLLELSRALQNIQFDGLCLDIVLNSEEQVTGVFKFFS
jgi:hypothetical protein